MRIKREKLLKDLRNFASQGNGVIIGSPGVGKTYLLNELRQNLISAGIPHLLLPIDQLGDGADKTLRQALSFEGDLIEKLLSVPVSDKKPMLLFDAFDAARNEQTRQRFLQLIRRAIQELSAWNVVVTVRTYDAKKSQELLDLFGGTLDPDLHQYQNTAILCRHFTIPRLNEAEIQQALNQMQCPESIYNSGSKEFKPLFAIPFNLWLLEKILKTSPDFDCFSHIRSEVQLLSFFWQRRIEGENNGEHRRFVLEQISHRMVEDNSLSVRQNDVYNDLNLDVPARQGAWDDLLSDEILAKVSLTGQRIAFSHNILFDYAISVLLIDDEPKQLERFILEDPSRPLFLRPSLTYFFTRLWHDDPETFWRAFWHIFPSNQSVHIRLFARLIPTSVIAIEAHVISQLTPFFDKLKSDKEIANQAVMWLLQSLNTLQIERDELWVDFFDQVSENLHSDFAWDLATITSAVLERSKTEDSVTINACGRIGRRLLKWIWQARETSENDWNNRLGSSWAVPLVAKTFGNNPKESRVLLETVLDLTRKENFTINFLMRLTKHVDRIWLHDPEFVTRTYLVVFTHNETSNEMTRLGGGPILPLASTRHQDYSSCQYLLIQHFPNFLRAAPLFATQTMIPILNNFISKTYIFSFEDRVDREDSPEKFNFRGKLAHYVQDYSCEWDKVGYPDEPIQMADSWFDFIAELAGLTEAHLLLDSLLDVFRDDVRVAFFWKRLLKTASQFPDVFAPRLFELCIAKPIHMGNDVLDNLCTFLKAAACHFTRGQRRQIEESILALPRESGNNRLFLHRRRNQLLEKIPSNLLITEAAKKIRKEFERENDVPEIPTSAGFESSRIQNSYDHPFYQGADSDVPENQELKILVDSLTQFSSDWLNGKPTEDAAELILPELRAAYAAINEDEDMDEQVSDRLWYKLTDCAAILSRVVDNTESPLFDFCRLVLLHGATHKLPEPEFERDAQLSSSSYSPFPRHEAAKGLLRLAIRQSDSEMLNAIEVLARDPVPSVRMVTATGLFMVYVTAPEKFWQIVGQRAANEKNLVVQGHMCATLTRVVGQGIEEEENTVGVMDQMLKSALARAQALNLSNSFVNLLMWLAIGRKNPWALQTIEQTFFEVPIQFAPSMNHAVSWAMREFVVPKNLESDDACETLQRAIKWLKQVIDVASATIEELSATTNGARTAETTKQLQDIYGVIDEVITRLYYTTAAHEKGQPEEIDGKLHCQFYDQVKPLMEDVTTFALGEHGIMFAPTAYRFTQLLTCFISCNPKEVIHLAERVARSSEPSGYNFDSLAIEEVVKFVEIVLADHRSEVRGGESLENLLKLLDMFAKAGWSDALRLVWRLDEIFR